MKKKSNKKHAMIKEINLQWPLCNDFPRWHYKFHKDKTTICRQVWIYIIICKLEPESSPVVPRNSSTKLLLGQVSQHIEIHMTAKTTAIDFDLRPKV